MLSTLVSAKLETSTRLKRELLTFPSCSGLLRPLNFWFILSTNSVTKSSVLFYLIVFVQFKRSFISNQQFPSSIVNSVLFLYSISCYCQKVKCKFSLFILLYRSQMQRKLSKRTYVAIVIKGFQ